MYIGPSIIHISKRTTELVAYSKTCLTSYRVEDIVKWLVLVNIRKVLLAVVDSLISAKLLHNFACTLMMVQDRCDGAVLPPLQLSVQVMCNRAT